MSAASNWREQFGYGEIGGSDSHLVSLIGLCATRFKRDVDHMKTS